MDSRLFLRKLKYRKWPYMIFTKHRRERGRCGRAGRQGSKDWLCHTSSQQYIFLEKLGNKSLMAGASLGNCTQQGQVCPRALSCLKGSLKEEASGMRKVPASQLPFTMALSPASTLPYTCIHTHVHTEQHCLNREHCRLGSASGNRARRLLTFVTQGQLQE